MGLLRVLLALSVVAAHSTPILGTSLVGGRVAVQTFFILSGFYMALVLDGKYRGRGSYRTFLQQRFLRLFPAYWFVLVLALLYWLTVSLISGQSVGWLATWAAAPIAPGALLATWTSRPTLPARGG